MLGKLTVSTLYKMFGNRTFDASDIAINRAYGTRNQQLQALVDGGDLHKAVRANGKVRHYLTYNALETFAPTVSWWAD